MPKVTFLPEQRTVDALEGMSLSDAARKAGIDITLPCAGRGMCGKCIVRIEDGYVHFENNGKLSKSAVEEGFVLACRSTVQSTDVTVRIVDRLSEEKGVFADAMSHIGIDDSLFPDESNIKPPYEWLSLEVPEAAYLDGLGDLDRFESALKEALTGKPYDIPLSVIKVLPDEIRQNGGKVSVCGSDRNGTFSVIDVRADKPEKEYGLSIDIGTTTVAAQLVSMKSGRVAAASTDYNEQIERGLDVISRISYAKNRERIDEMQSLVLGTVNGLIERLLSDVNADKRDVFSVAVAGNTTMTELALGIVPEYIRLEPYTPAVMETPVLKASDLGLDINPAAEVRFAPNVGSYVGGDITAGLLCTDFAKDSEDTDLFIDIGTNGEIVFGNADFLLSCACSAGPAFEGGGIEYGMRASQGAIETVSVADDGTAEFSVIGGGEEKGICGSGLISLIAQLFEKGIIDSRGKFDTSGRFASVTDRDGKPVYEIGRICITEADIDNLIRAKAAIFSACRTLLKSVEMDFDCINNFYIAGGFGRYIDIEKAQAIGLLPKIDREKFKFIGNSSLAGSYMSLISPSHREKISEMAGRITYIDLSTEAGYMDEYISAMFIPHTDESLFR
ncbi:MAG: DUF4445 domain-containing protein [Christensenellaceae bacterium]|nr:DUF4445 domain-containing protein [Christensenellaceae bacterium]